MEQSWSLKNALAICGIVLTTSPRSIWPTGGVGMDRSFWHEWRIDAVVRLGRQHVWRIVRPSIRSIGKGWKHMPMDDIKAPMHKCGPQFKTSRIPFTFGIGRPQVWRLPMAACYITCIIAGPFYQRKSYALSASFYFFQIIFFYWLRENRCTSQSINRNMLNIQDEFLHRPKDLILIITVHLCYKELQPHYKSKH